MVQDYHYLNEYTVKNNYPLPLIAQLVDKLQEAKLFTKMDLRWEYNNVHIKGNDEWKAAFTCFCGSFEPLVMYFGLCNSSATFQVIMNEIFADIDDIVVVYINNLIIFTKTENQAEHNKIVLDMLRRLEENDLFVMLNGMPSSELGRNALALMKLLGLGVALKGDGESSRTRCVRTLTAESKTYKYMCYYQIW